MNNNARCFIKFSDFYEHKWNEIVWELHNNEYNAKSDRCCRG